MDNFSAAATIVGGFVPTWLMLAKVYRDIGKLEQQVRDLNAKLKNLFSDSDDRDEE